MSSIPPSGDSRDQNTGPGSSSGYLPDDTIDLRDLFLRFWRGLNQTIGLALLGLVIACVGFLLYGPFQSVSTTTRVSFAFPGFEKGEYPDKSKFQPDDIRAPDIIVEALKRRGLENTPEFQSKVRAALSIEGIIPPNIVKDRDRLRATGQTVPAYLPDEYVVTFTAPRKFALSYAQRAQLLVEIVSVYKEDFRRTYADTPLAFGNAFETLKNADYPDYEQIFDREMSNITTYLAQHSTEAKLYRSPTTNLTFGDLLRQTQLFEQIRLNQTLGLIHQNGLSIDRRMALVKMNDALRLLNVNERRALDEESVVRELLAQAQNREQNYVLGIKTQTAQPRSDAPILDQGMIDSLLANDSYNFLMRRALDAGIKVKLVQVEKAQLLERIEGMKSFAKEVATDQAALIADVKQSIASLETAYGELISNIRKTHTDFSRQKYGDAIRLSDQIITPGTLRSLAMPGIVGLFLGGALGAALSLLGVYIGRRSGTV